ncbi:MAG: GAF domain-containing protein [Deltaproteobacteria bacterium]|nr:GAF domain-containing protein [Deltaproteobacteria bacterium]
MIALGSLLLLKKDRLWSGWLKLATTIGRVLASLRARLLLLVLLSVIPAFGLILYTASEQKLQDAANAKEKALAVVRDAVEEQRELARDARRLLSQLAQQPEVKRLDQSACSLFLADQLEKYPEYSNLGVIDLDGDVVCSALPLQGPINLADRGYFQRTVETRDFCIGEYQVGRATGKATLNFGYPLLDNNGKFTGVVFAALDLGWLNQLLAQWKLSPGSVLFVMDQNATILARYPEPEKWVGKVFPQASMMRALLSKQREGIIQTSAADNTDRLYAFSPLRLSEESRTYIGIGTPARAVYADADRVLIRNLLLLGIVGFLALLAAWFGGDLFILKELNGLVGATKALAEGDLTTRAGPVYRQGELGHLARSFDVMADSLEQRTAQLNKVNRALRTLSECNQILVRAEDEIELLNEICRAIVNFGGYRLAWVGYAERDEAKAVRPVAQGGYDSGYLETVNITWADTERGRGPTGRAIRTGKPSVARNILTDSNFGPWTAEASRRGYASSVALPLTINGQPFGALNIYAGEPDAFDSDEEKLFCELAADLSYGISALRTRLARQRAEAALRESDQRFRMVVEAAKDYAIFMLDPNGRVVNWNSGAERIKDYRAEEIIGEHFSLFYRSEDIQEGKPEKNLQKATTQDNVEDEGWRVRKDGSEFLANVIITSIRDEFGNLLGFSNVTRDITERKRAEEELKRNLERIRALHEIDLAISSTLDLHSMLDVLLQKTGSLLLYNAAATVRLVDRKTGELKPAACWNLNEEVWKARFRRSEGSISKEVIEKIRPVMIRDFLTDPRVRDLDFLRQQSLVSYLGLPLIAKGEVLGILGLYAKEEHEFTQEEVEFLTTIAGQAAIAIHNSQLYEQAMTANKAKSEFLSVMSHELRTPLTAIMGYTGLVKDGMFGEIKPQQAQALGKVMRRSNDLLGLINGILQATQLEAREVAVERREIDLRDFLHDLRSAYDVPLEKDLTLNWDLPPNLPVLKTDSVKLKHILHNIIHNAIKFTEAGKVTISARHLPEGKTVEFKVSDTGIGIPKQALPSIFEMFRQLDSSETRLYEGAGLGLYIAKNFTELLGGRLDVESEVGQGSSFTVRMPV